MVYFEYKALDGFGKEVKGKIDSPNKDRASLDLQKKKLYPISIKESDSAHSSGRFAFFNTLMTKLRLFQKTVPRKSLAEFSRQFGTLILTGIPYHRSLEIYTQELKPGYFQNILSEIKQQVLEGTSLTKAFAKYPRIFDRQYLASIQAGEKTGLLGKNLVQQADFMDEQNEIAAKLQTALIYPGIMAFIGGAIVVFMVKFIIPKITPIFNQFGKNLPVPTKIVIFVSDLLSHYPLVILFAVLAALVGINFYVQSKGGKKNMHKWVLRVPVLKILIIKLILLKFTQTLEILLRSGVDIREALLIAGSSTGNSVFEEKLLEVQRLAVNKGYSLSQALKKNSLIDEKFIQIIKVGEESGRLEEMIAKVAEQMRKESQGIIQQYLAFLEPVIIVLMALFVGFIVLAIMLPIFEMNQVLQ